MKKSFTQIMFRLLRQKKLSLLLLALCAMFSDIRAQSTNPSPYCTATHGNSSNHCSNGWGFHFLNVALNGSSYTATCDNSASYRFLSNLGTWTTLSPGASYTLSMQVASTTYSTSAGAWIDYNDDKSFGSTEWLGPNGSMGTNAPVFNRTFTVPCNAKPGLTRLRVRCDYNLVVAPQHGCGNSPQNYGETFDFTILISAPSSQPSADFVIPDTVYVNSPVRFVNVNRTGYVGHEWDLLNVGGSIDATSTDFAYTFTTPGSYQLKLTSTNCTGSAFKTKNFTVVNPTSKPKADFVTSVNNGVFTGSNLITVDFYDLSQFGASSWEWIIDPNWQSAPWFFSQGFEFSQNPQAVFYDEGEYDVCLVASNSMGSDTSCKYRYIKIAPPGAGSNYVNLMGTHTGADLDSGIIYDSGGPNNSYDNNENYTFLIAPCAAESVTLNFRSFSTESNNDVVKVYNGSSASAPLLGTYSGSSLPSSIMANSGKMFLEFQSNGSSVQAGFEGRWSSVRANDGAPTANFVVPDTVYDCSGSADVKFRNTSTGVLPGQAEFDWIFEYDPLISYPAFYCEACDEVNPEWTYSNGNTYQVRMVLKSCEGNDTIVKSFVYSNTTSRPLVDFTTSIRKIKVGGTVDFEEDAKAGCSYEWTIFPSSYTLENGTTSTDRAITAKFTAPGSYNITLKVTNDNGSTVRSKTNFIDVIDYCKGTVNIPTVADVGITKVVISDIENESSSGVSPGYSDYTSMMTDVVPGQSYSFRVERPSNVNTWNVKVWVDWNRDGDFGDANEVVFSEPNTSSRSVSGTFTVPSVNDIDLGDVVIRVGTALGNGQNNSCGPNMVGEFEDYTLNLTLDKVAPVITLIGGDVTIEKGQNYTEQGAVATDNIEGNISSRISINNTMDLTQAGIYYVFYNVSDLSGNKAIEVRRTVTIVEDMTLPTLVLQGANPLVWSAGVAYVDPGYTAMDDPGNVNITNLVTVAGTVDINKIGNYVLTYEVSDNYGNEASTTRLVQVRDNLAPVVVANASYDLQVGMPFMSPVTLTDNFDKNPTLMVISGQVNTNVIGNYIVKYGAMDASGNMAIEVTVTYRVNDYIAPMINFYPGTEAIQVDVFDYNWDKKFENLVTATDNYFPSVQLKRTLPTGFDVAKLGTYAIEYEAIDNAGNKTTKTRTVFVVDREAPIGSAAPVNIERWKPVSNWIYDMAVTDNYNTPNDFINAINGCKIEMTRNNVNVNWPAVYQACYIATDASGNRSREFCRTVIVDDVDMDDPNSVNEIALSEAMQVYPNPNSGKFTLSIDMTLSEEATVVVMNAVGVKVAELQAGSFNNGKAQVDLSNLSAGVYFVRLYNNDQTGTKKVVLSK